MQINMERDIFSGACHVYLSMNHQHEKICTLVGTPVFQTKPTRMENQIDWWPTQLNMEILVRKGK